MERVLTEFSTPDMPRGVGRPPLKPNEKTVAMTMRTDRPTLARIEALVGQRHMAKFLREAVEEKLQREEAARPARAPRPPG